MTVTHVGVSPHELGPHGGPSSSPNVAASPTTKSSPLRFALAPSDQTPTLSLLRSTPLSTSLQAVSPHQGPAYCPPLPPISPLTHPFHLPCLHSNTPVPSKSSLSLSSAQPHLLHGVPLTS